MYLINSSSIGPREDGSLAQLDEHATFKHSHTSNPTVFFTPITNIDGPLFLLTHVQLFRMRSMSVVTLVLTGLA